MGAAATLDLLHRGRKARPELLTIAPRCGFNNGTYLKNLFKKRLGLSMREFRARATAD